MIQLKNSALLRRINHRDRHNAAKKQNRWDYDGEKLTTSSTLMSI